MGNPKLAKVLRCTGLALLVLGVLALVPSPAQAGVDCSAVPPPSECLHGFGIQKGCQPSSNCNDDLDCDNGTFCDGAEQCNTESATEPHVLCTIRVTNTDDFGDSITLRTACDTIKPGAGDEVVDCTIEVTAVVNTSGDTTCAVGDVLGDDLAANNCIIGAGDQVTFTSDNYLIQADDPQPLPDQATVSGTDNCDGIPSGDCNTSTLNTQQFSSQTTLTENCVPGTPPCPEDNNACTTITCNETTDGCDVANKPCDDNDLCTSDACDPATGQCVFTPGAACDDNDACTTDTCDPATGNCTFTPGPPCDDNDVCTDDTCDPVTGECVFTPDPTNDPSCDNEEICRTPGFWGARGGTEKVGSVNITQAVLDEIAPVTICGVEIDNTTPHFPDEEGDIHSAKEAICVSPKGDSVLQLARQLTAAALNCAVTNSTGCGGGGQTAGNVCNNVSIEDLFNACNEACADGFTTPQTGDLAGVSCIDAIDCFNNGGTGLIPGPEPGTTICVGDSGCHERPLVNGCFDFPNPGPAGSPKGCNNARKNDVEIFD